MNKATHIHLPATLDSLTYSDSPIAEQPARGEISIRLRASSLNYHDYAVVTGLIPTQDGRIPLSDGVGEVIAIGQGVTDYAMGDLVMSTFFPDWSSGLALPQNLARIPGDSIDGFARLQFTGPATAFTPTPKNYTALQAATLPCAGLTAWRALLSDGELDKGATVLVQGTGGVSIFALQFAKALGATVIATSSSNEKLARLKDLGADHLINYKENPKWGVTALGLTQGLGVDHVIEVGGAGTLGQSMIASRNGGHIALIGVLAGYVGPVNTALLMSKQLRVQGLTVGSRQHQLDMINFIDRYQIKPIIDQHFKLQDLAAAFRHQASGSHFGKIVIDIA